MPEKRLQRTRETYETTTQRFARLQRQKDAAVNRRLREYDRDYEEWQRKKQATFDRCCWFCKQPVAPKRGKPWPKYDLKYDMWICSPEHAPSGVLDERDYVADVREAEAFARDIVVRAALRQDPRLETAIRAAADLRRLMADVGPRVIR